MNFSQKTFSLTLFLLFFSLGKHFAQSNITGQLQDIENGIRPIQTAVPFLTITPNARASGMADQGVATSPDEYSPYWNPGKLAQIKKDYGFGVCYNPWLRKLVNDMSLSYLTGYYKLRKEDAISASLTYFDLGSIQFTDTYNQPIADFNPREFSFSGTYSRLLGKGFSAGITLKYIYSNLTGNISNASTSTQARPGQAAAADIGFYYNRDLTISDRDFNLGLGLSISNIGNKISYSNDDRSDFLPTMLRLGSAMTYELDDFNKITLGLELSKLMVPTSEVLYHYVTTNGVTDTVAYLAPPQKGLLSGMFGSFGDAPFGFKEELQEVIISTALEYWYDNLFAVRTGYFYENPHKGNRSYLTFGLGLRYNTIGLDFSYLMPTVRDNPLANTLRFALSFNFEKHKKEEESAVE